MFLLSIHPFAFLSFAKRKSLQVCRKKGARNNPNLKCHFWLFRFSSVPPLLTLLPVMGVHWLPLSHFLLRQ